MRTQSRALLGVLVASCSLSLVACGGTDGDGVPETQADEVKKKVKPKGGNGALDLIAPGFTTTGFAGAFTFDNAPIKPGERIEKVPNRYTLSSSSVDSSEGRTPNQNLLVDITAGAIAQHQLGGLRVRFAEPVTLGSARVDLTPEVGYPGFLLADGPWHAATKGASMLVLAGKIGVLSATTQPATQLVTAGALTEVVLPTAHVAVVVDAYDGDYPTPDCGTVSPTHVRGGAMGYTAKAYVRKPNGTANGPFVVPQGDRAPVTLVSYGVELAQATVSGQTHTFTLNRLEIDDVEIMKAGGGSQKVKGTVTISRKNADGTYTALTCTFPTHAGIDLPDGSYRVVSRAQAPSGVVTSTEDVSFP
jgi:hypothetical protein